MEDGGKHCIFFFVFSFSSSEKQKNYKQFPASSLGDSLLGDRRCFAIMSSLPPSASKHNTTCHPFVAVTQKRVSGFKNILFAPLLAKPHAFFFSIKLEQQFHLQCIFSRCVELCRIQSFNSDTFPPLPLAEVRSVNISESVHG